MKPGVMDSIWSNEMHSTGALVSLIEPRLLTDLVRHGRLVMAP